jgi:DNA-binding transcriptional MerR regulator
LTGVSTDTLRHYERVRVLPRPPRTSGGYRQYPPEAVDRVRLVRRALAMGFRLEELVRILRVRDQGGAPCRQVYAMAIEKLAQLDQRIAELATLRGQLSGIVTNWGERLDQTPVGQRAGLLEALLQAPSEEETKNENATDGSSHSGERTLARAGRPPQRIR